MDWKEEYAYSLEDKKIDENEIEKAIQTFINEFREILKKHNLNGTMQTYNANNAFALKHSTFDWQITEKSADLNGGNREDGGRKVKLFVDSNKKNYIIEYYKQDKLENRISKSYLKNYDDFIDNAFEYLITGEFKKNS